MRHGVVVRSLIDPLSVRQSGLGRTFEELPTTVRMNEATRGVVIAVYPPGHPENPDLGQTLVDVQPTDGDRILYKVPLCTPHAHQDTPVEAPFSSQRQPYAPRARHRLEGSSRDVRWGSFVLVTYLGGLASEPIAIAGMRFDQRAHPAPEADREFLDDLDGDGVVDRDGQGLDADLAQYPRWIERYNGVTWLVDNRGNVRIQTGARERVFPGHGGIPASGDPQGNVVVSTRGTPDGRLAFISGDHPRAKESSDARQRRTVLGGTHGAIRDETRDAANGSWSARLRSKIGRFFASTRGSDDGRVYLEGPGRGYLAVTEDRTELHGDKAVLDGEVYLGHANASGNAVTHAELDQAIQMILQQIDLHTHTGVETGEGTSGPPSAPITPIYLPLAETFKAQGVHLDPTHSASPSFQEDPDAG